MTPGGTWSTSGATVFDTALGPITLAWSEHGITRLRLPPAGAAASDQDRDDLPDEALDAIRRIRALLEGGSDDLLSLSIDLAGVSPFDGDVYRLCREVGPGRTTTYGDLARRFDDVSLPRRIGQSLARNPVPLIVPCHRVLAAQGGAGGFSAPGSLKTKLRLLAIERACASPEPLLFETLPLAIAPR